MHASDGLQLVGGVEDGLHQQHVRGLNDVQPVGARVQRKQQDVDLHLVLERAQVLLWGRRRVEKVHSILGHARVKKKKGGGRGGIQKLNEPGIFGFR